MSTAVLPAGAAGRQLWEPTRRVCLDCVRFEYCNTWKRAGAVLALRVSTRALSQVERNVGRKKSAWKNRGKPQYVFRWDRHSRLPIIINPLSFVSMEHSAARRSLLRRTHPNRSHFPLHCGLHRRRFSSFLRTPLLRLVCTHTATAVPCRDSSHTLLSFPKSPYKNKPPKLVALCPADYQPCPL